MKCSPTISLSAALGFALVLPSRGWAQDYIVRTVSDGGSIAGSVIYAGGAVERSPVNVTTDQGVCDQTPNRLLNYRYLAGASIPGTNTMHRR